MARSLEEDNEMTFWGIALEKKISVGHIITTLGIIAWACIWYANTESRLGGLEGNDKTIVENYKAADQNIIDLVKSYKDDYRSDLRDIKDSLRDISNKMDAKADKGK